MISVDFLSYLQECLHLWSVFSFFISRSFFIIRLLLKCLNYGVPCLTWSKDRVRLWFLKTLPDFQHLARLEESNAEGTDWQLCCEEVPPFAHGHPWVRSSRDLNASVLILQNPAFCLPLCRCRTWGCCSQIMLFKDFKIGDRPNTHCLPLNF